MGFSVLLAIFEIGKSNIGVIHFWQCPDIANCTFGVGIFAARVQSWEE
jgi:hypothetical protein